MKLVIVATHPIQYQVPWYRELSRRDNVDLTVYFALIPDAKQQSIGFGVPFQWDLPLLEGYHSRVLKNRTNAPSLYDFLGLDTPGIIDALREDRPDAVIITGWHTRPMLQALLACIRLGIPRIIRGEANAMRRRRWWVRLLHRILLSRYDAFLAIGKSSRDFYLDYGIPASRVFLAPYSVENERFSRRAAELLPRREELRAGWNIQPEDTCFLMVGKLEPKKHIMDVLRALKVARASGKSVHLLVVGMGEELGRARAMTEEHQLPATFAGFLNQTEIAEAYVAADCLVLASDYGETWGLVVNEAMSCGRPALVSDRAGCGPDLIVEGQTGSVFPFGDVRVLASRMMAIASEPQACIAMGACACRLIDAYSVRAVADGTLAAVRSLTTARP